MATALNGVDNTNNEVNNGVRASVELSLRILKDFTSRSIPRDDVEDFKKLLDLYFTSEDEEEKDCALKGVVEILLGESLTVSQMDFEKEQGKDLKSWTSFVGKRIKEYRKKAKLSQEQLAEKAGIAQSHLSRLETSEHSPSSSTREKIAKALGIDPAKLDPCAPED